ncbi:MAG: hypothetical protein LBI42_14250 [Chitinispirillales bacterium]|jgi:hypothetical protein|nr:hypothetical protein [Chitinispirillales bacterium]
MKRAIFSIAVIVLAAATFSRASTFEGNDDNVTRDYYVQLYNSEPYVSDFKRVFKTENDKRDYKKLRQYINYKEEILRILKMAGDEYYYGLSYSKLFAVDYLQNLEDELKSRKPGDKILLRISSVRPSFDYNGEYTAQYIETEILPRIKARHEETASRDSLNQIAYMQIQKNIEILMQDIFQAEQAMYMSLSPEFRDQDFRIWISLTFSGLIGILLLAFFLIIFKRSDISLSKQLLSSSGLQFITVFILIIAIILFGILNVLGGSELAAILSGISGYILGKGGGTGSNILNDEKPENGASQNEQHSSLKQMEVPAQEPFIVKPLERISEEGMDFTDLPEESNLTNEFDEKSYG